MTMERTINEVLKRHNKLVEEYNNRKKSGGK